MKRSIRVITLFLGVSMFLFGVLKFIDPFQHWYEVQILSSGLPFGEFSYWAGQVGELVTGVILIAMGLGIYSISSSKSFLVFVINNLAITLMMGVAVYVHLHPEVPSEVLPLKIKPPFIPAFFILLSLCNISLIWQKRREQHKL